MSHSGIALPTGESYKWWRAGLSASWTRPTAETVWAERMYDEGTIPFVHLMIDDTMKNIADGHQDPAIAVWLYALKRYQDSGRKLVAVLFPEMNGNWTPYGQEQPVNHSYFIKAFRDIVTWGREIGLDSEHIQWCFAPNDKGWVGDRLELWYPGDFFVDHVGGSVYNWGGIFPGKPWLSPRMLIGDYVDEIRDFTSKHIVITQTGSGLNDTRSPAWLTALAAMDVPWIWFNISEFRYGPGRDDWNDRVDEARCDVVRPDHWFDPLPTTGEFCMKDIEYGDGYTSRGTANLRPTVAAWQAACKMRGFRDLNTSSSYDGIDGIFGSGTVTMTRRFQASVGLAQSGRVGEAEWKAVQT